LAQSLSAGTVQMRVEHQVNQPPKDVAGQSC
jgi:hypothetical protein